MYNKNKIKITPELEEEIVKKYFDPNKEHTFITLALACNISVDTIRKIFRKRGLKARKSKPFQVFSR